MARLKLRVAAAAIAVGGTALVGMPAGGAHAASSGGPPTAFVDVAVATVWTSPAKPRKKIDAPALANPVNMVGNSDTIYGDNGPCDASGYGISDLTYENNWVIDGISSYKTHSYCWGQQYWKTTSGWSPWTTPCKTWTDTWEVWYVGAACNDQLYSMWVWDNKAS